MAKPLLRWARHNVSSPLAPELVGAVRRAYDRADQALAQLVRLSRQRQGPELACREGCAACCTYVVATSLPEAELIAEAVEHLPTPTRQAVIGRLVSWVRAFRQAGHGNGIISQVDAVGWQTRRIACPLLEPLTNRCLVYADRPLACRVHHACRVPPGRAPECERCVDEGYDAQPPEGCFTTVRDVAHGHATPVLQLRGDLGQYAFRVLMSELSRTPLRDVGVGSLPWLVLDVGRERYGWKPKLSMPLRVLDTALGEAAT